MTGAAETARKKRPAPRRRSDGLLAALDAAASVVIVTHDNPDPDAIAAGWALLEVIRARCDRPARLVGGGAIVRAENRHFVKLLKPPIELVTELPPPKTAAAVLVDCSLIAENHLLAKENLMPVAVIDHHTSARRGKLPIAFWDVRPSVAAAASIASSYLREQGMTPDERLATALSYAIRTETRGSQFHHARLDRSVLRWLAGFSNPAWIAEIESAPLPRAYFGDLGRALASAVVHDGIGFCLLPRATGTEIVGEVADLLIRGEMLRSVLCAAVIDGDLLVSVRTRRGGRDASMLVRATLAGLGGGGGHTHRAGGKVPADRIADYDADGLSRELTRRWLAANEVAPGPGRPLIEESGAGG